MELSAIKSTYNHFLASYEAQVEVENATQVEANKRVVCEKLKKLYMELEEVKHRHSNGKSASSNETPAAHNQQDGTILLMKFEPYIATELEERAIMLFNSDRRYTITE